MDFSLAWDTIAQLGEQFAEALPRFLLALLIVLVAVIIGRPVRGGVRLSAARRREHYHLQIALGRLAMAGVILLGVLRIVLDVLERTDGVAPDPKADVIVVDLADSSVHLRARWWSDSRIADVLIAQDKVLSAVKWRLQQAGIDLPFPTHQVLLHDQTEESDGDRRRQREGWPAGEGDVPPPRGIARALAGLRLGGGAPSARDDQRRTGDDRER